MRNRIREAAMLRTLLLICRSAFVILLIPPLLSSSNITKENQEGPYAAGQASRLSLQQHKPVEADRIERSTSEPYKGNLSIFEDPERAEKLQIERVMDLLGIKQGSSVADIGAGSGWFTVRAARRVGGSGMVYAVEINQNFLNHIKARAEREGLPNIQTVLGKEDDPVLPSQSVDAVLLLKTYHEIAQPVRLLSRLRAAMKPNALVGIIDKNGNGEDHGIASKTVVEEAGRAGFLLVEQYDFVKPDGMDYFLVFKARPELK
jgi:cyclopropane fatty-acyl-phospholipid synthase-like methyltransferase